MRRQIMLSTKSSFSPLRLPSKPCCLSLKPALPLRRDEVGGRADIIDLNVGFASEVKSGDGNRDGMIDLVDETTSPRIEGGKSPTQSISTATRPVPLSTVTTVARPA